MWLLRDKSTAASRLVCKQRRCNIWLLCLVVDGAIIIINNIIIIVNT